MSVREEIILENVFIFNCPDCDGSTEIETKNSNTEFEQNKRSCINCNWEKDIKRHFQQISIPKLEKNYSVKIDLENGDFILLDLVRD